MGTTVERRAAHGAVASALTEGDPQRAWQLAAATALPDEVVAAALEQAAQAARARTGFGPAATPTCARPSSPPTRCSGRGGSSRPPATYCRPGIRR